LGHLTPGILSSNQSDIENINIINAKPSKSWADAKLCIVSKPDVVSVKSDIQVKIGQGNGVAVEVPRKLKPIFGCEKCEYK